MKALILSHLFPNSAGNRTGTFILDRAKHLAAHCDVTVIAPVPWIPPLKPLQVKYQHFAAAPQRETVGDISVVHPRYLHLPRGILFACQGGLYYRCIRNAVRHTSFDLVYAHPLYPDGYAGLKIKQAFGTPLVVTIGGDVIFDRMINDSRLLAIAKATLQEADAVFAVANYQKDLCTKLSLVESRKISVIPPGADVSTFRPMDTNLARRKLGIPSEQKLVLCVSKLYAPKGLPYLLQAFAQIYAEDKNYRLYLVGDGHLHGELERQAKALNIEQGVSFVGFVDHHQLPLWYNACDLMVLASTQEGFPTVIPEALACGKPVVATKVGGVPDVLSDSALGVMVPSRSPGALADAIIEASTSSFDSRYIASNGRRYSWQHLCKKMYEIFVEVCSNYDGSVPRDTTDC